MRQIACLAEVLQCDQILFSFRLQIGYLYSNNLMPATNLRCVFILITLNYLTNNLQQKQNAVAKQEKIIKDSPYTIRCTQPIVISNSLIELGKCNQHLYIMPLDIGSPSQRINVVVSTSTNFLGLIVHSQQRKRLNLQLSSALTVSDAPIQTNIENKVFLPKHGADLIQIDQSVSTRNQIVFFSSNLQEDWLIEQANVFGILGLGSQQTNSKMLYNALQNDLLQSAMFTLAKNKQYFYLYYNHIPTEILENSNFVSTTDHYSSQLSITSFCINGVQVAKTNGAPLIALIDSTAPYLALSQKFYAFVVSRYFKSCLKDNKTVCSCPEVTSWPIFSLEFQKINIQIAAEHYMSVLADGSCQFNFKMSKNISNEIVLGSSLFSSYNVTFDQIGKRIGFQKRSDELITIDSTFFMVSLYIMLAFVIVLVVLAIAMLWYFRVIKNQRYSRLAQISLSTRFLDIN